MSEGDHHEQAVVSPGSKSVVTAAWDHRIKKYAVLISVLALIPSAASAAAAFMSWRTAQASLELARSVADKSGAQLEIDETMLFEGNCDDPAKPLVAAIGVRNAGHLPGRVTGLALNLYTPHVSAYSQTIGIRHYDPGILVDAQGFTYIDVPLLCLNLSEFRHVGQNTLVDLVDSVWEGSSIWTVSPTFSVGGNNTEPRRIRTALIGPND